MNKDIIYDRLKNIVKDIKIDEPMKNHTTFKIGGPADILVSVSDEEEIKEVINLCLDNNINYLVLGNGSNILVKDDGYRGVVIKFKDNFNKIERKDNRIYAQSGALLTAVSRFAMNNNLEGFEFANGIPGTLGGAVTMNAGAYGGEMKDVVSMVRTLNKYGEIKEYTNEEMNFRYRNSKIQDDNLIVLGVEIKLNDGEYSIIKEKMADLTNRRTTKQPLDLPSSGSTFKRPEGYYAAKLIEDSGLKGLIHGGAQVSSKHSGFIVNIDNASCEDVLNLIKVVQKTVYDKYNVKLEREVRIVGEDL